MSGLPTPGLGRDLAVRAVGVLVLLVVAAAASGCAASLRQREIVAHFQLGSSLGTKDRVAQACSSVPHASPEPLPTDPGSPQAKLNEVRFRIDKASNQDLDALLACLQRFPQVRYVDNPPDQ